MGALHCIVNPASRDYTCGKRWPSIAAKLESKGLEVVTHMTSSVGNASEIAWQLRQQNVEGPIVAVGGDGTCLLYTSPSPRDATLSRMPSSA